MIELRNKKRIVNLLVLLVITTLLMPGKSYCQDEQLENLKKEISDNSPAFAREKLFIHTDKSLYQPNEIIWMKLYVTEAITHRPLDISKLAYVELINESGKAVLQGKIDIESGQGNGSFVVPSYLPSGKYLLRSYTNWMKNAGPDYFFTKLITILNVQKKPEWSDADNKDSLFVTFFPEGGNLVNGIVNTVAFQITDKYGKGINANGLLINRNNDTLIRFTPLRYGLGHFSFTPAEGGTYAVVLEGYKYAVRFSLPEIKQYGYVMHLEDSGKSPVTIQVATNLSLEGTPVFLLGHSQGAVQYSGAGKFQNGKASFSIDTSTLAPGITTFTVFDGQHNPVCERLFFKRPSVSLDIRLESKASEYSLRQKIDVDISAYTASVPAENGNLSVSVVLNDSLAERTAEDISSYLWLSSDLKGNVENPGYYFYEKGNEVREATNNLMMTHGWRRLISNHILSSQPDPLYLPEYSGPLVQVKVVNKISGKPVPKVTVYLSIPDEHFQFHSSISDTSGICNFIVNNFFGDGEMVLQTNPGENNNYRLEVITPYFSSSGTYHLPPLKSGLVIQPNVNDQVLHAYVQQAFSGSRATDKFYSPSHFDTTAFFGKGDSRYLLDDYTRFTTMEEVMREYIMEVLVRKNAGKYHFRVRNVPYKYYFDNDPLVLLDGVPLFDIDKIMAFDPLKIKSASVVARNYYLSGKPFDGIISYTTYKGDMAGMELDPAVILMGYEGVQLQREFYSPRYESNSELNNRIPDFRNVLYWKPDIYTDANGKAHISFYSSDLPGNYKIFLQGITQGGTTGRAFLDLKINENRRKE